MTAVLAHRVGTDSAVAPRRRLPNLTAAAVALSAFGPYVGAGVRTEQLAVYACALIAVLIGMKGMRLSAPAAGIIGCYLATLFVAILGALSPPDLAGYNYVLGLPLAGIDTLALPIAAVLLAQRLLASGAKREDLLRTVCQVSVFAMCVNTVLAFSSQLLPMYAFLSKFWDSAARGDVSTTTVAGRAAQLGRLTGAFNQPDEAGIMYGAALLMAVYLYHNRPRRMALAALLLGFGGLLTVSKIFVVVALPIAVWQITRGRSRRIARITWIAALVALSAGASWVGLLPKWTGSRYLAQLVPHSGDNLVELYSGGRFGSNSTVAPVVHAVLNVSPISGIGADGLATAYDSAWVEALVYSGLFGILCYTLVLLILWYSWSNRRRALASAESTMIGGVLIVTTIGSVGYPALTGNRVSTILWIVFGLTILAPRESKSVVIANADPQVILRPVQRRIARYREADGAVCGSGGPERASPGCDGVKQAVTPRDSLDAAANSPLAASSVRTSGRVAKSTRFPAPAIGQRRHNAARSFGSRTAAAVTDQVIWGLQNFLILFAALHSMSIGGVGSFTLAYTMVLLAVVAVRSLSLEPLTIRYTLATKAEQRLASISAAGLSLTVGLVLAVLSATTLAFLPTSAALVFVAAGAITPVLFVQDAVRFSLFASQRLWAAAANDLLCLGVTAAIISAAIAYRHPGAPGLLILWGAGTSAGIGVGLIQTRAVPRLRAALPWFRSQRDLGPRLAGEVLAQQAAGRLSLILLSAIAGVAALGEVSASRTLMMPTTTLITATFAFAVPDAVRLRAGGGPRQLTRYVWVLSVGLAVSVAVVTAVMLAIPDSFGEILAGKNWAQSKVLLLPAALWAIGMALSQGPRIGLRAVEQPGTILRVAMWLGAALLVATVAGALLAGASGAAWAFGIVSVLGTAPWLAAYHRANAGGQRAPAPVPATGLTSRPRREDHRVNADPPRIDRVSP